MRIVSYNILDGGEGRADPLAEVIEAQRPDVVGLVEATDLTVIERIARRLEMDFIHAPGRKQGSALLTKWTIRESINHALLDKRLSKSLLETTLVDDSGTEWLFGVVHLHAHAAEKDEQVREGEIQAVRDVFASHRAAGRAHIIMGDFNAVSPVQQIDPEACKPSTRKEWVANGGYLPRRVVQSMLSDGYIDTLLACQPEQAATAGTFSTQFPGQRVDYIFTHGIERSRVKAAWIEYDRLAKYASDHFPIVAEVI